MSKELPPLRIGKHEIEYPIVQGGMSIKVAGRGLVKAVADCGAAGTFGGVNIGYGVEEYKDLIPRDANRQALRDELQKMKGTDGMYGVNLLTAITDYNELVKIAAENGAKFIVSGAGLPLNLPLLTSDHPEVALIPIVSSARALGLISERWWSKYGRLPDAFIVEAPGNALDKHNPEGGGAGGHLGGTPKNGFTIEQRIYAEDLKLKNVILEIKAYFEKNNIRIPLIAAGGIWDRNDIDYVLGLGFDGVQMATRFVCTTECDVSLEFKQKYIDSTKENIIDFMSPLGLYGRAIRTKLLDDIISGKPQIRNGAPCSNCLSHCSKRVCLAHVLNEAFKGNVEEGIVFAGSNAWQSREKGIAPVREIFDELVG